MSMNGHMARAAAGIEARGKEALRRQLEEALDLLEAVTDAKSWTRENGDAWAERYAALLRETGRC